MKRAALGCPWSFLVAQQNDQRTFAAIRRFGLAISQHFLALRQPAAYQLAQDGNFLRRTQALAMNDPDATLAVMQAFGQKSSEPMPGIVAVQAVQVDFILCHPTATSQVAQNALGQPAAQVMRLVTALQSVLQADMAMQAFMQCSLFVGEMLKRAGWRRAGVVLNEIGRWERLDAGHRSAEFGLFRGEIGRLLRRLGCCGSEIPVRWQRFLAWLFPYWRDFFAGLRPERGWPLRFVQLNAVDRRQWLDVGHCRLEGSKVFRVDQIQASWSR